MIGIDDIKSKKIVDDLLSYEGDNPYIRYLKKKNSNKSLSLTKTQIEYIKRNINKEIVELNNVIHITNYFGEQLQKEFELKTKPEKILIETLIGDTDKAYHVIGKFFKNQKESKLFWLPKTQLVDDLFFKEEKVDIDFNEVEKLGPEGFKLFEHQKIGVKFLLEKQKCILSDDQGLGKTKTSIIASLLSNSKKVLIICPSSLKINWFREINDFVSEDEISIIRGSNWNPNRYTIINYDILKNFHTLKKRGEEKKRLYRDIVKENFDLVIMDECHLIKNSKSNRGKIVDEIFKETNPKYLWLLTGTPIANRPIDFFNLLKMIKSPIASDWVYYSKRYCGGHQMKIKVKGKLKTIFLNDGSSNLEELNERTKTKILRRLKKDTLDLPNKIITPIYLELENKTEYSEVYDNYIDWRRKNGLNTNIGRHLVELQLLRKFIALEKVNNTIQIAENSIEQGKKVIIFTNFKDELQRFRDHFKDTAVYLDGSTKESDRQKSVDEFQNNDKIKVFVGQIKAAGVGITLTKAEVVIINSLDWVPGNLEQSEDRAYRIGTMKDVIVYYPLVQDTVDTLVWDVLKRKKEVIDTIIGDNNILKEIVENI